MKALEYLKSLSDPTRLRLYHMLSQFELNVNEIVGVMKMGQSRISRHLKILSDSGLLSSRQDGLWVFYKANEDRESAGLAAAVKQLIEGEPLMSDDLAGAESAVRERRLVTQRFFNSIAGDWEGLRGEILGDFDLNGEISGLLSRYRKAESCRTVVDVGCGTGDLIFQLRTEAELVIGVDSSMQMLDRARRRFSGREGIELRLGEAEHLPLKDNEADAAIMNMVLHHLSEPAEGIEEVNRVLKPGKLFVIVEFEKHGQEILREVYGDRWLGFQRSEVRHWLDKAGFVSVEEESFEVLRQLHLVVYSSMKKPREE
ncbi:MAG TPA: metalloregulator ArsR/SmtB family transcription factor [Spirochaetia bacterium]|nr:metalloregulator ArsR/SmtB family transcription factor [Spirochaetia bacterium]